MPPAKILSWQMMHRTSGESHDDAAPKAPVCLAKVGLGNVGLGKVGFDKVGFAKVGLGNIGKVEWAKVGLPRWD